MTQRSSPPDQARLDRLTQLAAHSFGARRAWLVLEDGSHPVTSHRGAQVQHKEVMRHAPIHASEGTLLGSLWVIVPAAQWNSSQQALLETFAELVSLPLERFVRSQQVGVQAQSGADLRQHYPVVLAFDEGGRIQYGNPAAVRLFRQSLERIADCALHDFVLDLHQVARMRTQRQVDQPFALRGLVEGEVTPLEGILSQITLGGKSFPCLCLRAASPETVSELFGLSGRDLREFVQRSEHAVIEWDARGRVLGWNPAAEHTFGYTHAEALGRSLLDLVTVETSREPLRRTLEGAVEGKYTRSSTLSNRTRSGRRLYCTWHSTLLGSGPGGGPPLSVVSIVSDVTDRIAAEENLRRAHARDQALREALPDLVFTLSRGGRFLDYHEPPGAVFYLEAEQIVGQRLEAVAPLELARRYREALAGAFSQGKAAFEHTLEVEGVLHHFEARLHRYDTEEAVCVVRDVTQRHRAEQTLAHMAFHDQLTDLPNRELFSRRLSEVLEEASTTRRPLSVAFVDLNRFKQVNDTLGHAYGDLLLEQVAARLREVLGPGDLLARMGGDEFTLILSRHDRPRAEAVAARVVEHLSQPFTLEGHTVCIGAAVGLSSFPEDGETAQQLLKVADGRMYQLKKARTSER